MHEHPEVIQILERAQARSRMHALLPQHASSVHAAPAWLEIGVLVEVQLHEPSWNVTGLDPFEMNWFRGTCVAIGPGQASVEFDDISDQESHMIDDVRLEHLRPRPPTETPPVLVTGSVCDVWRDDMFWRAALVVRTVRDSRVVVIIDQGMELSLIHI